MVHGCFVLHPRRLTFISVLWLGVLTMGVLCTPTEQLGLSWGPRQGATNAHAQARKAGAEESEGDAGFGGQMVQLLRPSAFCLWSKGGRFGCQNYSSVLILKLLFVVSNSMFKGSEGDSRQDERPLFMGMQGSMSFVWGWLKGTERKHIPYVDECPPSVFVWTMTGSFMVLVSDNDCLYIVD